jgi:hypothetical protein
LSQDGLTSLSAPLSGVTWRRCIILSLMFKTLLTAVFLSLLCGYSALAHEAPVASVAEKHFTLSSDGEAGLSITARAPGTAWGRAGAEAAILTCKVDGQYNQDVILFLGEEKFTYRLLLGRLAARALILLASN